MPEAPLSPVRIWDLPTRIFHWVLAATVLCSIVSARVGGSAMEWHFRFGYLALMLLAFRVLWGLVGGRWSRFASFVYAPSTVLRQLRGKAAAAERLDVGHSPTGALSVFALLGLLMVQVTTGLVADDEVVSVGPLNRYVSSAVASQATSWHADIGQWILIGLLVLHVVAIAYYRVKKRVDLVGPMITGDKALPADTPASADGGRQRLRALVVLALCVALTGWVWKLGA